MYIVLKILTYDYWNSGYSFRTITSNNKELTGARGPVVKLHIILKINCTQRLEV